MQHGIALGIDGGTRNIDSVISIFFVIGQCGQVGEQLQSPSQPELSARHQHAGKSVKKIGDIDGADACFGVSGILHARSLLDDHWHGLLHELQSANSVSLISINPFSSAPVLATLEFAVNHHT